jgi:hypothetical protein
MLLDVATMKRVWGVKVGSDFALSAFSPDGHRVALGLYRNSFVIVATDGRVVHTQIAIDATENSATRPPVANRARRLRCCSAHSRDCSSAWSEVCWRPAVRS